MVLWSLNPLDGAFRRRAPGRIRDSILLRMGRPYAVLRFGAVFLNHFVHLMADLIAMSDSYRSADISCNEDPFVVRNDASGPAPIARRSLSHGLGDLHEVFIP